MTSTDPDGSGANEAQVITTDMPGLVDVLTPDGELIHDLTVGQLEHLRVTRGWLLIWPEEQQA